MKKVVIHVDRLVLRGIPAEHRNAFVLQFRQELTSRLADPETARRLSKRSSSARMTAGPVPVPGDGGTEDLGRQTAMAIAREMRR